MDGLGVVMCVVLYVDILFHLRKRIEQLTSAQGYVSLDERHADEVRCFRQDFMLILLMTCFCHV